MKHMPSSRALYCAGSICYAFTTGIWVTEARVHSGIRKGGRISTQATKSFQGGCIERVLS